MFSNLHFPNSAPCLCVYPGETLCRVVALKTAGLKRLDQVASQKRLDQVAIAEKTGSGCDRRVAGTTTSDKDSETVDAEDT